MYDQGQKENIKEAKSCTLNIWQEYWNSKTLRGQSEKIWPQAGRLLHYRNLDRVQNMYVYKIGKTKGEQLKK